MVLFGLFLTLSSTLYGANTSEVPEENKASSEQKPANNAQTAEATVVNDDNFSSDESPSRARSAPPPRQLCKKCKMPGHQKAYCPAKLPTRQPLLVQCNNSSNKPAYPVQQININNNTPQISDPIGIGNNSLCYDNLILYPINQPLYNLYIVPPSNTQNNLGSYNMPQNQVYPQHIIHPQLYNTSYRSASPQTVNITQQPLLPHLGRPNLDRPEKSYYIWSCTSIRSCDALLTVINCLQYWQACKNSGCLKNIFKYLSKANSYMELVGAYHHLLNVHLSGSNSGDAYRYINAEVKKSRFCKFITCGDYTRNQRKRREMDKDNDQEYIFLRDLLDTIHAYLMHGYDSGHRYLAKGSHKGSQAASSDDEKKNDSDDVGCLFDHEMKALQAWQARIRQQQRNQDKSDKFQTNINQINNELEDSPISLALLAQQFSNDRTVQLWIQYLKENECDTDNVLEQIEDGTSIIYAKFRLDNIKAYIKQRQASKKNNLAKKGLYSSGVKFYYWDYYKRSDKTDMPHHPNLPYKYLYVPPAYGSLKDELLAKGIPITRWNQKIYEAKMTLWLSPMLRLLKASVQKNSLYAKYNIRENGRLYIFHIVSVFFYTNFTSLCRDFRSSFHYLSHSESLQDVIKRNAKWHFLSKYLRETVEVFGEKIGLDDKYKYVDQGSFYHGMPYILFRNCTVCFYGPLSTSKQLAVATLFTHKEGLVVQLESCGKFANKFLKFFNVSLISCFAAEDERLFIGGQYPLQIVSIRLLKQNMNTLPLIHTLNVVGQIITGKKLEGTQVCWSDVSIFKKLLSESSGFPLYIQQIWDKFRNRHRNIKINIGHMYKHYRLFIPLLFSCDREYTYVPLLGKLATIFPNIKEILFEVTNNINSRGRIKNYLPSIVLPNFMLGIKDCLHKGKQDKWPKLQKVIIKTYKNKISDDYNLYPTQFGVLGWYIGKGRDTIEIVKHPYENCISKLSFMIQGRSSIHEATSLDKQMLDKLMAGGSDVPYEVQQTWTLFQNRWQKININMRYMYKYYRLFIPLLCSSELKYKNLLHFDKIAQLFPNAKQIICTSTDHISGYWREEDTLPGIINSNFMLGLIKMLSTVHKQTKLKKIIIQISCTSPIKDNCDLYATEFGKLGWQVGKGDHTIVVRKSLYDNFKDDFIAKLSTMIGGQLPPYEITSLDIVLFRQLITTSKHLPWYVQQAWTNFRYAQKSICINMRHMHKPYKGLSSLLLSKSITNLLLLDKLSEIFPNATQIICEHTNCIITKENNWRESWSPFVVGVNFIFGLQDRLSKIPKRAKLKKIIIKVSGHQITVDCNVYATPFGILQWSIQKENRKHGRRMNGSIILKKGFS